jgi:hypothetical protein
LTYLSLFTDISIWDSCFGELIKTTYNVKSCFQLIYIKLSMIAYRLFQKQFDFILSCVIEIAYLHKLFIQTWPMWYRYFKLKACLDTCNYIQSILFSRIIIIGVCLCLCFLPWGWKGDKKGPLSEEVSSWKTEPKGQPINGCSEQFLFPIFNFLQIIYE